MSQMTFGLRIAATDDTQGTLHGALAGFKSFASTVAKPITIPFKFGMNLAAALRDINLGLRPFVAGLDHIISRASALDAVSKSFRSLTGTGDRSSAQLARRLVEAAHGAMRLQDAVQLSNRAIASGLNAARDLPTISDFASKKAVTTGMDMGGALERIIMGLSRMSAPILDDFGLLNDGIEGVQRKYEALRGAGTWQGLTAAAQKAEFVRQAMEDMHRQLGRMGVSGNESVFVWTRMKNEIGDSVDKLMAAIGRSKALQSALQTVRDTIAGMTKHIEGGGSFWDFITGKKGGKSGGLLGFLKAGIADIGELAGQGFVKAVVKAKDELKNLFDLGGMWDRDLAPRLTKSWNELKAKLLEAIQPLSGALDRFEATIRPLVALFMGKPGGEATSQPATSQPGLPTSQPWSRGPVARSVEENASGVAARAITKDLALAGVDKAGKWTAKTLASNPAYASATKEMLEYEVVEGGWLLSSRIHLIKGLTFGLKKASVILAALDLAYEGYGLINAAVGYSKAIDDRNEAQAWLEKTRAMAAERRVEQQRERLPHGLPYPLMGPALGLVRALGVTGARAFDRVGSEAGAWQADFPPPEPVEEDTSVSALDPARYPMQHKGETQRKREIYQINRSIALLRARQEHTDKYEVARRTREAIRNLRGQGADVRRDDRQGIKNEIEAQVEAERAKEMERLVARRGGLYDELEQSTRKRRPAAESESAPKQKAGDANVILSEILRLLQGFIGIGAAVATELASVKGRLAVAGPRRS